MSITFLQLMKIKMLINYLTIFLALKLSDFVFILLIKNKMRSVVEYINDLLSLMFYAPVNSYGHVKMVTFLSKLD